MPLSNFQRQRIISLWTQPKKRTVTEIKRIMAHEGVFTTAQTIKNTIARWEETGTVRDRPRIGRRVMVPQSHYRFIDETMAENDECTASEMKKLLSAKFGADYVTYSERTIARVRSELGWTFTTARYCQAIRDGNKEKRVAWVNSCLETEECFEDVIFTDECTVQLECHRRKSFRKKNAPRKFKYRHKHPPKIHVWAGISKRGATQLVMFGGIMTATRYGDILSASLVPFLRKTYPDGHRLYQDNDPKHTSRYVQALFQENRINWWKSPAESPDLNPIEKVWGSMKNFLRDKHKPRNMPELKEGIRKFWRTMTPQMCCRYIDHLQKVMPDVIEANGAPSGH